MQNMPLCDEILPSFRLFPKSNAILEALSNVSPVDVNLSIRSDNST